MPRASIIVVTFNNKTILSETIRSLLSQSYNDFEVVVIDNNSTDGTYEFVRNNFPGIICIKMDKNTGFAAGNNTALKYSKGEFIALLNNDAVAQRGWLESLVNAMDSSPDAGICASKMLVHGTNIIDSAGDGFSKVLKGFKRGEWENNGKYSRREYVFGACAGAALYRRKMLDEIGFFDEDFFLIHEDTDLNFRAQLAGWKVLYVPDAVVHHKVRSSIGRMSDIAVYYTLRNSEFVRLKNIPLPVFIRCLPEFVVGMLAEFLYFTIKYGKLWLYLKAKADALRLLPQMLKKRRLIMKTKKVSNKYLYDSMTSAWNGNFFSKKIKKFLNE